ncbi:MAG: DUF3843 family protein [Saprospiraceae bacterium]
MSKRRLSVFAVGTADWMKFRPYTRFSPQYDGYYLKLANQVFEELNDPVRYFRTALNREQLVELAVVLSSWFEDYANEIGIWSTFVRKNKDLFGYQLPFFSLENYNEEDLNPEDIVYLLWHYCCKTASKFIDPLSPGLMELAETLADLFDEALNEAPGTDFYDDFLHIPEDIYFFELKGKLHWMAFQNYLLGPEFGHLMKEAAQELFEKRQEMLDNYGDPGKLLYTMQDDYHYKKSSSFLAYTTPEWLAEVADCPETLRADIRRLFQRIIGEFVYEGNEGKYYQFRHFYTKRLFKVHQQSVELKGIMTDELVFTTIVNWRGDWWVTGTLAGFGNSKDAARKAPQNFEPGSISYYAYEPSQQQTLREMSADMEQAHLEFFGDRMVFFKNNRDLKAALEKQTEYYNQTKSKAKDRKKDDASGKPKFDTQPDIDLSDIDLGKGFAIFFEPGEGLSISASIPIMAQRLAQKNISQDHAAELFFDLFKECSPTAIRYLLDKYSMRNLAFPVKTSIEIAPHLEFLMRFYNPGNFREVLPNTTLMLES